MHPKPAQLKRNFLSSSFDKWLKSFKKESTLGKIDMLLGAVLEVRNIIFHIGRALGHIHKGLSTAWRIALVLGFFLSFAFWPHIHGYIMLIIFILIVLYCSTDKKALEKFFSRMLSGWVWLVRIPLFILLLITASIGFFVFTGEARFGLFTYIATFVLPIGYQQDVLREIITKYYDMPGIVFTRTVKVTAVGELGYYTLPPFLDFFFLVFTVALGAGILITIGAAINLALKKRLPYNIRYAITLAVVLSILCTFIFNPKLAATISRPVNNFIYWGHAESLVEATRINKPELVRYILSRGGDIHKKNSYGKTAVGIALETNNKDILGIFAEVMAKKSLEKKKLADRGIIYSKEYFFRSIRDNDKEAVRLFLKAGMDVNETLKFKYYPDVTETALIHAVNAGQEEMVEFLIENGAKVNQKMKSGVSALLAAAEKGHIRIAKILIDKGAKINHANEHGDTALILAMRKLDLAVKRQMKKRYSEVALFLIKEGADVNAKNKWGYTALYYAAWSNDLEVVKTLLKRGADVNAAPYGTGLTPLTIAEKCDFTEMAKLFEEAGGRK